MKAPLAALTLLTREVIMLVDGSSVSLVVAALTGVLAAVWMHHHDPGGFALEVPPGWKVDHDTGSGRIQVTGPGGERMVIWPMTVSRPHLSPEAAAEAAVGFAHAIEPQLAWAASPGGPEGWIRLESRGGSREGVTLMAWGPRAGWTAVAIFCMTAASGAYAAMAETFARIAASYRPGTDAGTATTPAAAPPPPAPAVQWTDPREAAFTVTVPADWTVVGGAYRLSATDVRQAIVALSPDGAVRIALGDANIGAFTMPTPMYAFAGLGEGSVTSLGDGSLLRIMRFIPGVAFVRQYVENDVRALCGGQLEVTDNRERPDLAGTFADQARREGVSNPQVTAGDASFTCRVNGRDAIGYYAAATAVPLPGMSPLWYLYRLYGFLAPPDRGREAGEMCKQVLESWQVNPAWTAQQRQISAQAVYQDNLRAQQVQSRALQAIADDIRQTSDIVSNGYWQRQQVHDEISRRRENAILGTVDLVDPLTGREHRVENLANYHWMDAQGNIAGTLTHTSPGVEWRQMIELK